MATGRVGKAVGDFMARRRSAKVRLGKTSVAKRHAFKKRTVFATRRRTQYERRRGHVAYARRMRPVIPVLRDVAVSKQVHHHSERNTAILRVPSASVVVSVTSACPGGN